LKFPYRVKDAKSIQKNFDYLATRPVYPWTAQYQANSGLFPAAPVNITWNQEDRNEHDIVTRTGANTILQITQSGFYTIQAAVLCGGVAGVPAAGRYDTSLTINGSVVMDALNNASAAGQFLKYNLFYEGPLAVGNQVVVHFTTFSPYDGGGTWNIISIKKVRA
jgi:hypothetical protein